MCGGGSSLHLRKGEQGDKLGLGISRDQCEEPSFGLRVSHDLPFRAWRVWRGVWSLSAEGEKPLGLDLGAFKKSTGLSGRHRLLDGQGQDLGCKEPLGRDFALQ